jgi:hypothetical protein
MIAILTREGKKDNDGVEKEKKAKKSKQWAEFFLCGLKSCFDIVKLL